MVMKRRLFSILLCLCLVLSMLPVSVFAEHECITEDGDVWCDICNNTLEHECIDENGKLNMGDVAKTYAHIRGTKPLF